MVNAYDGIYILAETCLLFLKTIYIILESTFRLFVPVSEKNVAGEIVLITGAGHGIGRELALKYASLGAIVVCWDLNSEGNQEIINAIKQMGGTSAHAYQCDVSKRDEVFKIAKKVISEIGHPTIVINNAGIMPCQSFLDLTPEAIQKTFDINVLAHIWVLQAFLPHMIANNHGHVVALSSIAGILGLKNLVPYCASKFAVRGLMEAMSIEYLNTAEGQRCDVKFTTIFPYMVDTGLCKKPYYRFPSLMSLVPPTEAAARIVTAQRRNYSECSIPRYWLSINAILRNFPNSTAFLIGEFLKSGVHADS